MLCYPFTIAYYSNIGFGFPCLGRFCNLWWILNTYRMNGSQLVRVGSPWVPRSRQLRGKFSTMLRSLVWRWCAAVHQQWSWLGTWASGEWYGSHGFHWVSSKLGMHQDGYQFLICSGECEFSNSWILAANAKHPLGNLGMCWICFCCGLVCWGLRFGGMDCSPYCRSLSQYLIDRWSAFLAGQLIIVFSHSQFQGNSKTSTCPDAIFNRIWLCYRFFSLVVFSNIFCPRVLQST